MKTTFLIYKDINAEKKELKVATHDEWDAILKANKGLPMNERRLFIKDCIDDDNGRDCMFIETSLDEYRKWHSNQEYSNQKKKINDAYITISIDDPVQDTCDLIEAVSNGIDYEALIIDKMRLQELRVKLSNWKKWADDMLDFYLSGGLNMRTDALCKYFGLSERAIRDRKRVFEEKIIEFLKK